MHFVEYALYDNPSEFDVLQRMPESSEKEERLTNLISRQKYHGNRAGAKQALALALRIKGVKIDFSSLERDFDLFEDDNKLMDIIAHFRTTEERVKGFQSLALLQSKRKDFNRARFSLQRALDESLSNQQTHVYGIEAIAMKLYALKDYGNYQKAMSSLIMRAKLLPKTYDSQRELLRYAGLQARHGDPNAARSIYESLIPEEVPNRNNSDRLTEIAIAQAEMGDLVHADQTLKSAILSAKLLQKKFNHEYELAAIAHSIADKVSGEQFAGGNMCGYSGGCSFWREFS